MFKKHSRQREAIIKQLKSRKDHPTADEVYTTLRTDYPNISLGTVYRNLTNLADNGDILRLSGCNGPNRFDGNAANHYHFNCTNCNRVTDVEMETVDDLNTKAEKVLDADVEGHVLMFYGLCDNCKNSNNK